MKRSWAWIWISVVALSGCAANGVRRDLAADGASASDEPATRNSADRRPAQTGTAPGSAPASSSRPTSAAASAPGRLSLEQARKIAKLEADTIALAKAGKYADCLPLLDQVLKIAPDNETAWYNLACVHSRMQHPKEAIDCLNRALKNGYSDFRYMEHDPDFDNIRNLPEYTLVLARNRQIQRQRAEKIHQEMRKQFGADYICQVDHTDRLVFATNTDTVMLNNLKTHLTTQAEAMWADLFDHRFEQYVTIVVPKPGDPATPKMPIEGYYAHQYRLLVAKQIGMVMNHEFTHALHGADMDGMGQRHPIWVTEGLATLFESSQCDEGHLKPLPNQRLNVLKQLVARKLTLPLKDFVAITQQAFMQKAMICYPQGRYVMMYLHDKGLLKKWYSAYTAGFEADNTGRAALEKVCGKKIEQIEADWLAWVNKLVAPPLALKPNSACLGVRTQARPDGLTIAEIVPASGAAAAGLKAGDVIVGIGGAMMVDSGELLRLVSLQEVGDQMQVDIRRDGQYKTMHVTLGALPANVVPSRPASQSRPGSQPASKSAQTAPASRKAA